MSGASRAADLLLFVRQRRVWRCAWANLSWRRTSRSCVACRANLATNVFSRTTPPSSQQRLVIAGSASGGRLARGTTVAHDCSEADYPICFVVGDDCTADCAPLPSALM